MPRTPARRIATTAVALLALTLPGMSPATATDPDTPAAPTTTETAAPTETTAPAETVATEAPAEAEADEPGAEPEDIPAPPAEDAEGLVDVQLPDRSVPIPLPIKLDCLLANVCSLNLEKTGKVYPPGDRYDGSATGLYFEADVLGLLKAKSRKLGAVYMAHDQSRYGDSDRAVVATTQPGIWPLPWLNIRGIESQVQTSGHWGDNDPPIATATTKIARLEIEQLDVDGIEVNARAGWSYDADAYESAAAVSIARLKLGSTTYTYPDIAPNTTYNLAGLGKVVLNEQKITQIAGDKYAAKVNAIHITLSTSKLGLPIGSDIYVGSAEAVVYQ